MAMAAVSLAGSPATRGSSIVSSAPSVWPISYFARSTRDSFFISYPGKEIKLFHSYTMTSRQMFTRRVISSRVAKTVLPSCSKNPILSQEPHMQFPSLSVDSINENLVLPLEWRSCSRNADREDLLLVSDEDCIFMSRHGPLLLFSVVRGSLLVIDRDFAERCGALEGVADGGQPDFSSFPDILRRTTVVSPRCRAQPLRKIVHSRTLEVSGLSLGPIRGRRRSGSHFLVGASEEENSGSRIVAVEDGQEGSLSGSVAVAASEEDITESIAVEDVSEDEQLSPEDEEDRENVKEILAVVEILRSKRDMTFNEVRLTVSIEDPRDVERRKLLNIEDDRGCSREEMALALVEVYEGRMPQDRTTLRELAKEMLNWPNLEDEIYPDGRGSPVASPYAKATDTGVDPKIAAERANVDWDSAADIQPGKERKDLSEVLPPAVGFSFLYLLSSLPIIIGVTVVAILFFNSLQ